MLDPVQLITIEMVVHIDTFIQAEVVVGIIGRCSIDPSFDYINHTNLEATFDPKYYLLMDNLFSILKFIILLKFVTVGLKFLNLMGKWSVFYLANQFIYPVIQDYAKGLNFHFKFESSSDFIFTIKSV